MKKYLPLLFLTLSLLCVSCGSDKPVESIENALKIYTYVYPESTEPSDFIDKSKENPDQKLVTLERILQGREYLLPIVGEYNNINNINFRFEYDGTVEVISEEKDCQLSVDENQGIWDYTGFVGRRFGYDLSINKSGWVAVLPLGFCTGPHEIDDISIKSFGGFQPDTDESILTVKARDGSSKLVVTAKLKIKAVRQNVCTVELISYDYSDAYRIMEAE